MLLPIGFTLIFCLIYAVVLHRWNARRNHSLPFYWLGAAFILRAGMGMLYGYLFLRYYHGDDTWMLHRGIEEEFQKLTQHPVQFWGEPFLAKELFAHASAANGLYYYLMDLENWLLCKPLALFQPFTQGNYYCQVILFNLLTFLGPLQLFYYFNEAYPQHRNLLYFLLFLFPPLVFWWSGLRSDGLLLLFTAFLLKGMKDLVNNRKRNAWLVVLASMAGMAIVRIQVLFLWVPAWVAYFLHVRFRFTHLKALSIVYGCAALVFFGSGWVSPKTDPTKWVAERQHQFKSLPGKTRFVLPDLEPGLKSYVLTFPYAFQNVFTRPHAGEAKGFLQWMAATDVMILWLLVAVWVAVMLRRKALPAVAPELIYPLFFALSLYLFIGYTIPFPGAIARYKVQAEYLILLFLCIGIVQSYHIKINKIFKFPRPVA